MVYTKGANPLGRSLCRRSNSDRAKEESKWNTLKKLQPTMDQMLNLLVRTCVCLCAHVSLFGCVCVWMWKNVHWTDNNWMMCKFEYVTTRCAKEFTTCWLLLHWIRNSVFLWNFYLSNCFIGTIHEHWTYLFLTAELRIQSDRNSTNNEIDYIHPFIHLSIQSATEKRLLKTHS